MKTMTLSDYLVHPAFGANDIIKMARSFAYYDYRKKNPEPAGRPLVVGGATHIYLESMMLGKNDPCGILLYSEGSSLTKGFKEFQKSNPGKYCLDNTEFELVKKMVGALLDEPEVMSYLKDALIEPVIMRKFPGTDIDVKCRPDYLHVGRGVSINIKTTTDASESGFIYAARDWLYDFQSAFYCDILSEEFKKPFDEVHILVEKTDDNEPCPVSIFSFGDDTIAWARSQIRAIMEKIPECQKTGIWPKNKAYLQTIDTPMYARKVVQI